MDHAWESSSTQGARAGRARRNWSGASWRTTAGSRVPGAGSGGAGGPEPIYREGRSRPLGYRLEHPLGGPPLAVVGHYEVTSGGCDTIRAIDGGLPEITRRAAEFAATGHDVLVEGQLLSSEYQRSAELARAHDLHILRLTTPLEQCARNLVSRRPCAKRHLAFSRGGCGDRARDGGRGVRKACAARHGRGADVRRRLGSRAGPARDPAAGEFFSGGGIRGMITAAL
jgi:hypothetical protein